MNNSPLFGTIEVKGPDAVKFLQGQVTCDVTLASSTHGIYGAHCTPKGKVLFTFFLIKRTDDCFWMQIPYELVNQAEKDLKKYSVFSKVTLSNISDSFPIKAYQIHDSVMDENLLYQDSGGVIRQRSSSIVEVTGNPELPNALTNRVEISNENWKLVDIQQGISHVFPQTRELFTPEEINYPLIDAVSFRKGCYTGQEIVARMHYKGKHKRHTHRFLVTGAPLPLSGSPVFSSQSNQKIGEIVSAVLISTHQIECLASVTNDDVPYASLESRQEKIQSLSLPYAIPVSDSK